MITLNYDDQTIIAQCTPNGAGALALLRISGSQALKIGTQISTVNVNSVTTHTVHFGHIVDDQKNRIDQVLLTVMHAPKTFTGQDTVEVTCHNNPFLIEAIIQRAIGCGARLATQGEFSKRAVINNKIDILQAEAINELIHAQTQHALKKSLAQLNGSFSHALQEIEKNILKSLAYCHASFEFIDEEDLEFGSTILATVQETLAKIEIIKRTFDLQEQIRQGIRIALIGSVNVGKSSLFNALLDKERAIVTPVAGTTRDSIEAGIYTKNNYWTLIDTAGIRSTDDTIEQAGIDRSFQEAEKADIVLLVYDSSKTLSDAEDLIYRNIYEKYRAKIITLSTKSDIFLVHNSENQHVAVSSKTGHNIKYIQELIELKIEQLFSELNSPFLLNKRQFRLLLDFSQKLSAIIPLLEKSIPYELVAYHLTEALSNLAELTGKSISEASMDAIFREFCIGK